MTALAPGDCQTMAQVREGVDDLDRRIVALLAARQGYIQAAARVKPDRAAVHDAARIEQVIAKVLAESERCGLSAAIAEPVWRTLIDRCIAHELETFDALRT